MTSNRARIVSHAILILMSCRVIAHAQDKSPSDGEPIVPAIDPSQLAYDYLVDGNLTQDNPAEKKFKSLQTAYAAALEGTESKPTVIGIKPNVYQIPGSMDRAPSLSITKNWITLLGLTNNRRSVVLADNRGLDEGAADDGYLLDVNATGFTAKNLTILNYCNCDYEYPGDGRKNLKMRNPTITQAVALQAAGDKHVYENVALLSRLDTMFLRTTRSYFKNVYIEGTDDWMGGGQISVWQGCTLVYPTGRGVMSASNVVFFNCKFIAARGMALYKAEFGGAARPDALINCQLPVSTLESRVAWVRGVAIPRTNQYTLTYKNTDPTGKPAVIYDSTVGQPAFTYAREISDQEMLAYNPWNLLRAAPNAAADNWDPANVRDKYEKAGQEKLVYRMTLRQGNAPRGNAPRGNARGAGVGGFGGGSPAVSSTIRTGGPAETISAAVLPNDATDKTITWSTPSDLVALSRNTGPDIVVTGKNTTEDAQYAPIRATASNGFYVTAYVYVEPKFIDPPAITSPPKLNPPRDGKVTVDYALDLGGRSDQSLITWFACDNASGANPRKIAVTRGNQPLKSYTLIPGDDAKFLRVSLEPKHAISEPGKPVFAISDTPIRSSDIPSSTVSPNFANFVETPADALINGRWTINGVWTIVTGDNLTNSYGIRAGTGARGSGDASSLFYFDESHTGDMQIDLIITPDKTEGTVFNVPGSPDDAGTRNSHGDIFIKFDPRTRTGYSLRYWRTTRSAAACTYQFYKIENGAGSPLNDEQTQSGVFKRNTHLTLKTTGSAISVEGSNTADNQTLSMHAPITPNTFSGAGVAASGAANIYSQIKVAYP